MAMSRAPVLPLAGEVDHHEAAAADVAGARIGHRHGEADRDRGIDRVAAAAQHVGADARGARLLRHHHAVLGGDRLDRRNAVRPFATLRLGGRERSDDQQQARDEGAADNDRHLSPLAGRGRRA